MSCLLHWEIVGLQVVPIDCNSQILKTLQGAVLVDVSGANLSENTETTQISYTENVRSATAVASIVFLRFHFQIHCPITKALIVLTII